MRNGVIIDEKDNVVVAIHELEAGTDVAYPLPGGGEGHVVTREHIPLFHKIAHGHQAWREGHEVRRVHRCRHC